MPLYLTNTVNISAVPICDNVLSASSNQQLSHVQKRVTPLSRCSAQHQKLKLLKLLSRLLSRLASSKPRPSPRPRV